MGQIEDGVEGGNTFAWTLLGTLLGTFFGTLRDNVARVVEERDVDFAAFPREDEDFEAMVGMFIGGEAEVVLDLVASANDGADVVREEAVGDVEALSRKRGNGGGKLGGDIP